MKNVVGILLIFLLVIPVHPVKAQQGWLWAKSATANEVMRVVNDGYGNSYIAGFDESRGLMDFGGITDSGVIYATEVDSTGNFRWAVATTKGNYGNLFPDITFDGAGNAYLLASFTSDTCVIGAFTLINTSPPNTCCFLAKISHQGSVVWAKVIGESDMANLCADYFGNVYVAGNYETSIKIGTTTLNSVGDDDIFLAKFSTTGSVTWAKSIGGINEDHPTAIMYSGNGHFLVAGDFLSTIDIGTKTLTDGSGITPSQFIASFDTSGKVVWANEYTGYIDIYRIAQTDFGAFFIAGNLNQDAVLGSETLTTNGGIDGFLAKCDSVGNVTWARSFGGTADEYNFDMAVDYCGKIWLSGKMGSSTSAYTMNFGDSTLTTPAHFVDPSYLVEYDSSGNYLQGIALASGGDDYMGVAVDHMGNMYASGDYMETNILFGTDSLTGATGTGEMFFLAKNNYDSANCYVNVSAPEMALAPEAVTLYPNPANDRLTISANYVVTDIVITNLLGQKVIELTGQAATATVNIGSIPPGMYFAIINNGATIRKFIKEP